MRLLAWPILGERIDVSGWMGLVLPRTTALFGIALIVAALAIVSWDTVRQHREIDPQMGQE